jgi:hypothetical protein
MPNITVSANVLRRTGLNNAGRQDSTGLRYLINALQAAESGLNQSDGFLVSVNDDVALGNAAFSGQAVAMLVASSGSGSVGGSICGTAITVTWATSDTASMTALAAAIRGNTSVNRRVTATNISMGVTLASVTAGQQLNVCGALFTAVNGTPVNIGEFDMSGTDTADATSLALAINRHPSLALRYRAVSSAGAVRIFPTTARTISPLTISDKFAGVLSFASTITVNTQFPVATAFCAVLADVPGDIGNECRLTASGTGMTAVTNGTTNFLGNGTGGGTAPYLVVP